MRRFFVGLAMFGIALAAPCFAHADDQQIAQQVAQQLRVEKDQGNLKGFGIDLQVDQGIVWLKGEVSSAAQQKLALDVARQVSGVQQVVDELEVRSPSDSPAAPTAAASNSTKASPSDSNSTKASPSDSNSTKASPSDDELAREIMARLKTHKEQGQLKGFSLQVKPNDGQVWMIGRVATEKQRKLVLNTVAHVPGVRQVVNAIRVETPVSEEAPQVSSRKSAGLKNHQATASRTSRAASPSSRRGLLSALLDGKSSAETPARTEPNRAKAAEPKLAAAAAREAASAMTPPNALRKPAKGPGASADQPVGTAVKGQSRVIRKSESRVKLAGAEEAASRPAPTAPRAPVAQRVPAAPPSMAYRMARNVAPVPFAPSRIGAANGVAPAGGVQAMPISNQSVGPHMGGAMGAAPAPMHFAGPHYGAPPARYDHPSLPGYAWPSYASHPNYAAVTYPQQYSPTAWPYIGPFYPYPQVPLGWRKVTLEWDDGWWMLDFKSKK